MILQKLKAVKVFNQKYLKVIIIIIQGLIQDLLIEL